MEALSLFSVPLGMPFYKLGNFVRFRELKNLFNTLSFGQNIEVICDPTIGEKWYAYFRSNLRFRQFDLLISRDQSFLNSIIDDSEGNLAKFKKFYQNYFSEEYFKKNADKPESNYYEYYGDEREIIDSTSSNYYSPFKKYVFQKHAYPISTFQQYLLPPHGQNLVAMLKNHSQVLDEMGSFFDEQGYELVVDIEKNEFEIQRKIGRIIYKYPFELMADTLQRIIFYLTAIETNRSSILLFEEPETHSFPPYIKSLAERIAAEKSNQYFIATHSPYLLQTLIENLPDDELAVYITYLDNFETKVKLLSRSQLSRVLDEGIDIFFNLDKFVNSDL